MHTLVVHKLWVKILSKCVGHKFNELVFHLAFLTWRHWYLPEHQCSVSQWTTEYYVLYTDLD